MKRLRRLSMLGVLAVALMGTLVQARAEPPAFGIVHHPLPGAMRNTRLTRISSTSVRRISAAKPLDFAIEG